MEMRRTNETPPSDGERLERRFHRLAVLWLKPKTNPPNRTRWGAAACGGSYKVRSRADSSAAPLQFLQVVGERKRLADEGQKAFEIFFCRLLRVEAGRIVWSGASGDQASGCQIAVALPKPATREISAVAHRAPSPHAARS